MRNRKIDKRKKSGVITFIITMIIMSNTGNGFSLNIGAVEKNMDNNPSLTTIITKNDFEFNLDESSSLLCLSCHDGVIASDPYMMPKIDRMIDAPSIGLSHPVMNNYSDSANRSPMRYTESLFLDPRIRLFNDKIECLSCHNPDSNNEHHLVMSNERSKLCMSCHNL